MNNSHKEKLMELSTKKSAWLLDFKKDVFSQAGEDGIIEKILQILPEKDRWCVEFGAWDGFFLSNTRHLIENYNYSAVLIEGDEARFDELRVACQPNKNIIAINTLVGWEKDNNLDSILKDLSVPPDFDFLCVDVDGNDYHIWKSISDYRPKAVCIEYNPTIPSEVRFVQEADLSINQGSSLLSLVELGKEIGYELICVSSYNAFFVDLKYYHLFEIEDNSPQCLRTDSSFVTYIFSGYDGLIYLAGNKIMPWHNFPLEENKIQHLPKILRKFPANYNRTDAFLFLVLKKISSLKKKIQGFVRFRFTN